MANNYYNFTDSFVPGTKVRSDDMNNELDGITAGFDVLPDDPQSINRGTTYVGTESGSANAYVVARVNPQTSYENGDHVGFFATHDNTSSGTLNVDGLGAVALVAPDGSALLASDITDGVYYEAVFDTANNRWQLMTPMAGTLTEADTRVLWAQEWAINPEDDPVSVGAGGDDATTFSSLHWAIKSSDSAAAAAASEASAAASFDEFDDRYLGSKASDPTLDNDGDPLLEGALYWNSNNNTMRVYNGSLWEDVGTSTANITEFTATAAQTAFTGTDDNGTLLTYQVGYLNVYLNGILLQGGGVDYTASDGSSINLTVAANAGDVLQGIGYGTFDIADVYTKVESDARFAPIVVPGALLERKVFTASGTWTKPAGLAFAIVTVVSGGAGGGATTTTTTVASVGGSGGGGGAVRAEFSDADLSATETVTVGSGGAGGVKPSGSGGASGLSRFGTGAADTSLEAAAATAGLGGGDTYVGVSGLGGLVSVGANATEVVSIDGQDGNEGFTNVNTVKSCASGSGGGVGLGYGLGGGSNESQSGAFVGKAGTGYGGGGAGGVCIGNSVGADGGAGVAGIVIVESYS